MAQTEYVAAVLADSPACLWACDESSGLLADSSGNGRGATSVTGSPVYGLDGMWDGAKAVQLPFGSCGFTRSAPMATGPAETLECCAYVDTVTADAMGIWNGNGSTNGFGWQWLNATRQPRAALGAGGLIGVKTATFSNLGVWLHLVLAYDATGWYLYVNGALNASNTPYAPTAPSGSFFIQSTANLGLRFSDIAVYNSALSAARVAAHYQAGIAVPAPTTVTGSGHGLGGGGLGHEGLAMGGLGR